jgi:dTDP-4-amino-4,6-dideoxygalactose transaminase
MTMVAGIPFYDTTVPSLRGRLAVLRSLAAVLMTRDANAHLANVRAFEAEFARCFDAGLARAVNSGTSALYFALRAVGVGPGSEVITVANTFVSTITSIRETGADCVFADVDDASGMMDPDSAAHCITSRTAAIVPVHMYGGMADVKRITQLAAASGVPVVEDACQAVGATQYGRYAGTWGAAGCFSFHATKLVGAPGDGGMIVTALRRVHDEVCRMAEPAWDAAMTPQGRVPSRLSPLSLPVLRAKLAGLGQAITRRTLQRATYLSGLSGVAGVSLLEPCPGVRSSYRNVVLIAEDVQGVAAALKARGVPTRKLYPQSLELVARIEAGGQSLPRTRRLLEGHVALPVGEHVGDSVVQSAIEAIRAACASSGAGARAA